MYIYRPNTGYHSSRKRPTRLQRREENDRLAALMRTDDNPEMDTEAAHDLFVGTVDSDFEAMDTREIRIGDAVTLTFGCGEPIVEDRRAA